MEPQLNQFIGCDKPFDGAKIVLFGAPYDSTTSFRPGTRFGPAAMRTESFGIETYSMLQDHDLAVRIQPAKARGAARSAGDAADDDGFSLSAHGKPPHMNFHVLLRDLLEL